MTSKQDNLHWQLNIDQNNIAWLTLDKVGTSTNTLDHAVFQQLSDILDNLIPFFSSTSSSK